MDYMQQNAFAFTPQRHPQFYYQQVPYPAYIAQPQHAVDEYYMSYNGPEYADFAEAGMMHDDMGDSQEISTRPRLTKEQAEILESHFQANHKPSSQVKRELALQTNLNLNRVGNWFQNRRAKAKQQKRQEEYEAQNAPSKAESKENENNDDADDWKDTVASDVSRSEGVSPMESSMSSVRAPSRTTTATTVDSISDVASASHKASITGEAIEDSTEASWNSLQRALAQAKAAQAQQPSPVRATMLPPEVPLHTTARQLPLRLGHGQGPPAVSYLPIWQNQHITNMPYSSPITLQDTSFDFGFDAEVAEQCTLQEPTIDPVVDYPSDSFVVTPEDFHEHLATPKGLTPQHQHSSMMAMQSPQFALPSYPESRRPSGTEDLSNHFGNVALTGTSSTYMMEQYPPATVTSPPAEPLDIAARRKRPRPAALTFSSLRSRSQGAMTSISPTVRQGMMSPQGNHTVRHVKSAGQGLHSRYAGVRKASSAQRSPMCASTFAEAEAFNQLMARQGIAATPLTEIPEPLLSPHQMSHGQQVIEPEKNPFFAQSMASLNQYAMHPPQNLSVTTASPPITPMVPNIMTRAPSQHSLMPPTSAPAQYATFPDYTPPYSAGPLTNSSWSDAPMTSPEIPSFPVNYMSSLGMPQHYDGSNGQFQQFVLRSDNKSEIDFDSPIDQKKTEFYIQEFPDQKEKHACVAQQLSQQKPKNYVFANTAPQDYNA